MKIIESIALCAVLTLAATSPVRAAGTGADADADAEKANQQAQLAYENALAAASSGQESARVSVEKARAELERAKALAERDRAESVQFDQLTEEQRAAMREELSRAHESLRQASREVARVHRELERAKTDRAVADVFFNLGDKPLIGVVLGESSDKGVPVLGVSPDGPADRAGIKQGDVIVSLMGKALADNDSDDARAVLNDVMNGVKAGDELVIAVERGGQLVERTVIPEKREPFAWQSKIRLPSAPSAPSAPHVVSGVHAPGATRIIEHIELPEISTEALNSQIQRIREDIDRTRVVIQASRPGAPGEAPQGWEYRFDSLSDLGGDALHEANVWFGVPATRGLQFAEIDAALGAYFKTDRGVLVVKANESNELQLVSGDVILRIADKEVNKPTDVMRALREWDSGADIKIEIKRDRKSQTLNVVLPEHKLGANFVPFNQSWEFSIETDEDEVSPD